MFNRTYNCSRSAENKGSFTTPNPSGEEYKTCTIYDLSVGAEHNSGDYDYDYSLEMSGSVDSAAGTVLSCGPDSVCYGAGSYLIEEPFTVCTNSTKKILFFRYSIFY